MNFEFNLALVLAHTLLYEGKSSVPAGVPDDFLNQGDPNATQLGANTGQSTGETMQALIQYLPQLLSTTASQVQPTGQTLQQASTSLAGPTNQADIANLAAYGPQVAQAGNQVAQTYATGGANTAASVAASPATQQIAASQLALNQLQNPQYYSVLNNSANRVNDLLNSINLQGLSGGEQAQVERSLNQSNAASGNANMPNALTTVGNAMTFGNALQQKQAALSTALNTASSLLPQSETNFNPVGTALSAAASNAAAAPGSSEFQSANPNATSSAQNLATGTSSNLLNTIAGFTNAQNSINSNARNSLDATTQVLGSLPNIS
jgi:hypothetical protein